MIKRTIVTGAFLAAGVLGTHADDVPVAHTGHIEAFGEVAWQDYWGAPYNPWAGGGAAGRVNWWLSPDTSMQFDLAGQKLVASGGDYSTFSFYGAAHYSKRNAQHLFGFFGGLAGTSDYYSAAGDPNISIFGGVEGQAHGGPVTFYVQTGFIRQIGGGYYTGDESFTYGFLQGEIRYFFNPNTKLAVNAGVVGGAIWGACCSETWLTAGAELEHRFSSSPLSIFARWQAFNGAGYYDVNGSRATAGIRYNFGNSSLQDENLNGATLKVFQDLAPIGDMRAFD